MPIYEYRCDDCGTQFEKLVRRDADVQELECPSCGESHLSQQYSTFAAHAQSSPSAAPAPGPCGAMCPTPGMCGRN